MYSCKDFEGMYFVSEKGFYAGEKSHSKAELRIENAIVKNK